MEIRKLSFIYSWIPKKRRKKILDIIYGVKHSDDSKGVKFLLTCSKTLRLRSSLVNLLGFYSFLAILLGKKQALSDASQEMLLITGKDYSVGGLNFNGSTKDTQSLIEDLTLLDTPLKLVCVSRKTLHAWIDLKPQIMSGSKRHHFSHILISIPGPSGFLLLGLRVLGYRNIHFRSHNAEAFHRLDWLRAEVGFARRLRILKRLFLGTISDFLVAFLASTVLVISKVEVSEYWNKLFALRRKRFIFFPYKPPSHIAEMRSDQKKNGKFVLIVGAYRSGTRISDADNEFLQNGEMIHHYFNNHGWELHSVGNGVFYDFCDVNWGYVEDLDELMRSADFVLVPTSKGWGFKTKILDALFNNIGVILTESLAKRSKPYLNFYSTVSSWSAIEDIHLFIPSEEAFEELRISLTSQRSVFYSSLY